MSPPEYGRQRARGRAALTTAANGFARLRAAYLRLPTNVRLGLLCSIVLVTGVLALVLDWPLLPTVLIAASSLLAFAVWMANPRGAASATVLVAWLLALPLMGQAYDGGPSGSSTGAAGASGAVMGADGRELAALALLGLLVVAAAHLLKMAPPWRGALLALAAAGVVGSLLALVLPVVGVVPAYVAAVAVLGYRMVSRRRARQRADGEAGSRAEPAEQEAISVEAALAELEDMIGLDPVKRQVRSIAASIEAAWMRLDAGYPTDKPMQHFVFVGPPGTGKTTVARRLARIFYAFGLLDRPRVVEAQRADLVGDYLGATALKTNQLVDSALGGVLFIDEAYGLVQQSGGQDDKQGDKFGAEAVQTLLKRAEDDREHLVIILAGYEREMEDFLNATPGLNSRFATRIRFPSYSAPELVQIAEYHVAARGEQLGTDAVPALRPLFEGVCQRGTVDELGNGRFVRSLVDAAAAARDVRVVQEHREQPPDRGQGARRRSSGGGGPEAEQLVTITATDVEQGYADVTARFRGYADRPTLEEALGELEEMVGLDPVKRQVRSIAAQLQVNRVRQARQGEGPEGRDIVATPPMRHFVFAGPPGTGKTSVARILGRVFAALGLLSKPDVVEATRVDLVGEYLGQTAVKTNKLVDSALGGVLFVDEAYNLYNEGYAGGDAFGAEAIATLLKRAEDDRHKLVIILAGYEEDMQRLLERNHGLASRFTTRVTFPNYEPGELREIAVGAARSGGDRWDGDAVAALDAVFAGLDADEVGRLGNGRFVRSLYEQAAAARDLRLADYGEQVSTAALTTLSAADVHAAYAELTGRG